MNDKRPINLDLGSLTFPPMAIASILHRLSGLVMFVLLPIMLYFLAQSLSSLESFDALQAQLTNPWCKCVLWGFGSAWMYHVMAGIRHMAMDFGRGESLVASWRSAVLVITLAVLLTILLGMWIW